MSKNKAFWYVELYTDCPCCKEHVNLLDHGDFWYGRQFDISEHGTKRSTDVEVVCPECGHEFTVDMEY